MEDYEISDYECPKCGSPIHTRDCDNCDDGMVSYYDEDPLMFDPDEYHECTECSGAGFFFWCPNEKCDITEEELKRTITQEFENQFNRNTEE